MTSHKIIRREMLKRMGMTTTAVALAACVPVAPSRWASRGHRCRRAGWVRTPLIKLFKRQQGEQP